MKGKLIIFICLRPMKLWFFCHYLVTLSILVISISNLHPSSGEIVGFYHIFGSNANEDYKRIVNEQTQTIENSGLIHFVNRIFYITVGNITADFVIYHEKYKHYKHLGEFGEEIETISILYDYCQHNEKSKVFYFHDKGSFHSNDWNEKFRKLLNCFVLTPHCIKALDEFDTCGWRISPYPFPHYSGNMWWANCQHINKLFDPKWEIDNKTFIENNNKLSNCIGSKDRFISEAWVTSAPEFHPADCMNASIDSSYLFGYVTPVQVLNQYCPSGETTVSIKGEDGNAVTKTIQSYGLECQLASTMTSFSSFIPAMEQKYREIKKVPQVAHCPAVSYVEIITRSQLWYGRDPVTYMKWIEPLIRLPDLNLKPKLIVRCASATTVYMYDEDELFHPVPNIKTFIAHGLDFGDVHVLNDFQCVSMRIGDWLPSV